MHCLLTCRCHPFNNDTCRCFIFHIGSLSHRPCMLLPVSTVMQTLQRRSCTLTPGVHPVLHILKCTSCNTHPVLHILYCTYCSAHTVVHILYCTSCTAHPVLHILYCTSCTALPVLHILYCTSCTAHPVVHTHVKIAESWLHITPMNVVDLLDQLTLIPSPSLTNPLCHAHAAAQVMYAEPLGVRPPSSLTHGSQTPSDLGMSHHHHHHLGMPSSPSPLAGAHTPLSGTHTASLTPDPIARCVALNEVTVICVFNVLSRWCTHACEST